MQSTQQSIKTHGRKRGAKAWVEGESAWRKVLGDEAVQELIRQAHIDAAEMRYAVDYAQGRSISKKITGRQPTKGIQ